MTRALAARHARRDVYEYGEYVAARDDRRRARVRVRLRPAPRRRDRHHLRAAPRRGRWCRRRRRRRSGARTWGDTRLELPPGVPARWRDRFTGLTLASEGGTLPAAALFERFPIALITPA